VSDQLIREWIRLVLAEGHGLLQEAGLTGSEFNKPAIIYPTTGKIVRPERFKVFKWKITGQPLDKKELEFAESIGYEFPLENAFVINSTQLLEADPDLADPNNRESSWVTKVEIVEDKNSELLAALEAEDSSAYNAALKNGVTVRPIDTPPPGVTSSTGQVPGLDKDGNFVINSGALFLKTKEFSPRGGSTGKRISLGVLSELGLEDAVNQLASSEKPMPLAIVNEGSSGLKRFPSTGWLWVTGATQAGSSKVAGQVSKSDINFDLATGGTLGISLKLPSAENWLSADTLTEKFQTYVKDMICKEDLSRDGSEPCRCTNGIQTDKGVARIINVGGIYYPVLDKGDLGDWWKAPLPADRRPPASGPNFSLPWPEDERVQLMDHAVFGPSGNKVDVVVSGEYYANPAADEWGKGEGKYPNIYVSEERMPISKISPEALKALTSEGAQVADDHIELDAIIISGEAFTTIDELTAKMMPVAILRREGTRGLKWGTELDGTILATKGLRLSFVMASRVSGATAELSGASVDLSPCPVATDPVPGEDSDRYLPMKLGERLLRKLVRESLILEELTKSDKKEIEKIARKQIAKDMLAKKEIEKIAKKQVEDGIKKALGVSFLGTKGDINKFVSDVTKDHADKWLTDKSTKDEIADITKAVMKKLYKDLSFTYPNLIDRIKV